MPQQAPHSHWSIRTLFVLLVFAAFVPLAISIAYHFYQHAEVQKRGAARTVLGLATSAAAGMNTLLGDTQRTAGLLAAHPQIRALDRARCDPLLRELIALLPLHANASVLGLDGRFVCSARPLPAPAPIPARHGAFERAVRGEATLSEPVQGALSRRWIVSAAHPVRDDAGRVAAVATVTIDVARLGALIAGSPAEIDTLATVVTGDGIVVARSVAAADWIGRKIEDVPLYRNAIEIGAGTMTALGLDGVARVYGIAPVGVQGWRVIVGSPSADLLAEARAQTRAYALYAALMLVLFAIAAAAIATRLARPVLRMDTALKLRAAGDSKVRIPEDGPRELAALARDFNAALDAGRESAIRFSGIIASAMDAVITVNAARQITLFNPAAEKMFGQTSAEMLGKSLNLLIPARYHPSHDRHIREFGETGVTNRTMGRLGEIVGMRASGEEFPIEASISQLDTPQGRLFTVILRDVTEHRQATDSLRKSQLLLQKTFDSLTDALFVLHMPSRQISACNPAAERLFGYRRSEMLGRETDFLYVDAASHDAFGRMAVAALNSNGEFHTEFRMRRKDGSVFPSGHSVSEMRDESGERVGVVSIIRDITERRKSETDLQEYAEQMRSLSQRLSEVEENERRNIHRELHDQIGANLAALKLDLAIVDSTLPQEVRHATGDRLYRAQQLTGETIARIRNVMADLRPPALDDFGLVTALRMHGESVAARLEVPVTIDARDLEPRLPPAVETALFRIVQEALHNIVKHASARTIRISISEERNRIVLSVADDGAGFDPAGVDPQRTNWGLRTMRERAQAIGADLRVESAPGRGTRVAVELTRESA